MSWGFSYAGSGKAVAEKVRREGGSYLPEGIKKAVEEIGNRVPEDRILYVDSSGHTEIRLAPEKQYDSDKSKAVGGKPTAKDGSDFDPENGDIVYGSGVLTFKILPKVV